MHTNEDLKAPTKAQVAAGVIKALNILEHEFDEGAEDDGGIISLRIAGPEYEGGDYMAILRRYSADGGKEVAFYGGYSLATLLRGVAAKINRNDLKWKADKYA